MFSGEYQLTISYYSGGQKSSNVFTKSVDDFDELKQAFLKRFGNINGASNSTLREKPLVKKLTYQAATIEEWTNSVNLKTRWHLQVRKL